MKFLDFAIAPDDKAHPEITCSTHITPYPVLLDEYDSVLPPACYFETVAKLGSILTRAPVRTIRAAVQKCCDTAHAAITFDCDVFPDATPA